MARACSRVWVWSFVLLCGSAAFAIADPLAVIAAFKGKVDVVPAGAHDPQHAAFGRALEAGDRVIVGAASTASLFYGDGNLVQLAEKSTTTIVANGAGAAKGKATGLGGEVYANVTRFVTTGTRATGLMASSDLRGGPDTSTPILLAPRRTTVMASSPAFEWRVVPQATRYRLTVSTAGGELWTHEFDSDELTSQAGVVHCAYPAGAAALAPDTEHLWKVEALSDLATLRFETSVFRTAPKGMQAEVDANLARLAAGAGGSDTPAARFLAGSYLSGLGLYHDAADEFQALARLTPESPSPHEALGNVYSKVGLMDLAAAEYQHALALGRETP